MGKRCKKCGMESDRDDLCTWCNADLREPRKGEAQPEAGRPAPAARPPTTAPAAGTSGPPSRTPRAVPASAAEKPERPFWLVPVICGVAAVVLLVVALILIGVVASGPPPAAGEWKPFTAKDNSFSAYYPSGWGQPSNSGSPGSYVLVDWNATKLARVEVQGTSKAGAIGDAPAALARAGGDTGGPGKADVAMLDYYLTRTAFGAQRRGYKEGSPEVSLEVGGVQTAKVEYEYPRRVGLLTVRMKGMRWGFHQGDYGYQIYAEAPAKCWAAFEPTALKILAGVKFGGKA